MAQSRMDLESEAVGNASEDQHIFNAFRRWGYLQADLDPLGVLRPQPHPELDIDAPAAREARRIYCGTIGAEFMHIADPERRHWIERQMEGKPKSFDPQRVLERLIRAELFEQVMQARYLGSKRFSLEGVTGLIPLLDEVLEAAAENGAGQAIIGMSHRGRLNVMAQIVGR